MNGATGATGPQGAIGATALKSGAVTGSCASDNNQRYYWNTSSGASYTIPPVPSAQCLVILQNNDTAHSLSVITAGQSINGNTGNVTIPACPTLPGSCPVVVISWDVGQSKWILGNTGPAGPTGATGLAGTGNFTLIQDQLLSSPSATVSFSSISGYRHLMILMVGRCTAATAFDAVYMQVNGDTGTNYFVQGMNYNQGTVAAFTDANVTQGRVGTFPCASAVSGASGSSSLTILNYLGTNFTKNAVVVSGGVLGATIPANLFGYNLYWNWNSTSAITSITFGTATGGNTFAAGTDFTLYGMN